MAEQTGIGLTLNDSEIARLFGEDQARYIVATADAQALLERAAQAGVPAAQLGQFGGDQINLGGDCAPLAELSSLYRGSFAAALALA